MPFHRAILLACNTAEHLRRENMRGWCTSPVHPIKDDINHQKNSDPSGCVILTEVRRTWALGCAAHSTLLGRNSNHQRRCGISPNTYACSLRHGNMAPPPLRCLLPRLQYPNGPDIECRNRMPQCDHREQVNGERSTDATPLTNDGGRWPRELLFFRFFFSIYPQAEPPNWAGLLPYTVATRSGSSSVRITVATHLFYFIFSHSFSKNTKRLIWKTEYFQKMRKLSEKREDLIKISVNIFWKYVYSKNVRIIFVKIRSFFENVILKKTPNTFWNFVRTPFFIFNRKIF